MTPAEGLLFSLDPHQKRRGTSDQDKKIAQAGSLRYVAVT